MRSQLQDKLKEQLQKQISDINSETFQTTRRQNIEKSIDVQRQQNKDTMDSLSQLSQNKMTMIKELNTIQLKNQQASSCFSKDNEDFKKNGLVITQMEDQLKGQEQMISKIKDMVSSYSHDDQKIRLELKEINNTLTTDSKVYPVMQQLIQNQEKIESIIQSIKALQNKNIDTHGTGNTLEELTKLQNMKKSVKSSQEQNMLGSQRVTLLKMRIDSYKQQVDMLNKGKQLQQQLSTGQLNTSLTDLQIEKENIIKMIETLVTDVQLLRIQSEDFDKRQKELEQETRDQKDIKQVKTLFLRVVSSFVVGFFGFNIGHYLVNN